MLLVQDCHAAFADPERGWLGSRALELVVRREFDEYFETLEVVRENLEILLPRIRQAGIPVVYGCMGYQPPGEPSAFQQSLGWEWDLSGPNGEFPAGFAPADGEKVFAKPGWGALSSGPLRQLLADQRISDVIIAGTMLDFGIRQTCYELGDRGRRSLVVSDAVAGLTRIGTAATTGNIAHGMTKLRTTAELIDLLDELSERDVILI
jgi:nicotinamidase-related amidase